jgi:uncharacterized glyoxalase superfamily protein PhnB
MANISPIPSGFHTLTPHLIVNGASDAIAFYQKAFNAEEVSRMAGPGKKLMHAVIRVGDSLFMLADESPQWDTRGPQAIGGSPITVHMYVEDADAVFHQAVEAGAKVLSPLEDQFWGDRYGKLQDPFGHTWAIATRKEDLSPSDILARAPTTGL